MVDVSEPHGALRRGANGSANPGTAPSSGVEVAVLVDQPRLMGEADLDWLTYLCKKRYSHAYDSDSTAAWFTNIVLKSPLMFYAIRSQDAFCISMLSITPWIPNSIECNVVFICADDDCMWQALRLLRCSIDWARRRKCTLWRISSDTDYDLRLLALRVGARELSPRYVLKFV